MHALAPTVPPVGADRSAAENNDVRFRSAGHAREQHAFAAEPLFKVFRPFLNTQAPGDLAHRRKARKGTVDLLDRLVSDRLDFARKERVRLRLVGGEVKVRIENQPVVEERIFAFERFLDFDHHVDKLPDVGRIVEQTRARVHVFVVREPGPDARARFDIDVMTGRNVRFDVVRREADSKFVVLDLFNATDLHGVSPEICIGRNICAGERSRRRNAAAPVGSSRRLF